MVRQVRRATYAVPELGIQYGDVVIWDAADPEHTLTVVRLCGRVQPKQIRAHLDRFIRLPPARALGSVPPRGREPQPPIAGRGMRLIR